MDDWDWIIVLYITVILAIGALFWLYLARPKQSLFPKDWVCDGCGQVCTELRHGLCNYCANFYKPTEHCRQRGK